MGWMRDGSIGSKAKGEKLLTRTLQQQGGRVDCWVARLIYTVCMHKRWITTRQKQPQRCFLLRLRVRSSSSSRVWAFYSFLLLLPLLLFLLDFDFDLTIIRTEKGSRRSSRSVITSPLWSQGKEGAQEGTSSSSRAPYWCAAAVTLIDTTKKLLVLYISDTYVAAADAADFKLP